MNVGRGGVGGGVVDATRLGNADDGRAGDCGVGGRRSPQGRVAGRIAEIADGGGAERAELMYDGARPDGT